MNGARALPAGNFSDWLRDMRAALASNGGMDVACGECRGCCTSSYYVKVRAHEARARTLIGAANLEAGPPRDPGSQLMGFAANGHCLMFREGNCSIYSDRPETCRSYDCRVYTAAGMTAGDDKPVINARIERWRFEYPTQRDQDEQRAVSAAARHLRQHVVRFPGGRVPSRASEIAVLAVKSYTAFLDPPAEHEAKSAALIEAVLAFDRATRNREQP